jgi:hypothetical protein
MKQGNGMQFDGKNGLLTSKSLVQNIFLDHAAEGASFSTTAKLSRECAKKRLIASGQEMSSVAIPLLPIPFEKGEIVFSRYWKHQEDVPLRVVEVIRSPAIPSGIAVLAESLNPCCENCGKAYEQYEYVDVSMFRKRPYLKTPVERDVEYDQ